MSKIFNIIIILFFITQILFIDFDNFLDFSINKQAYINICIAILLFIVNKIDNKNK